MQMNIWGSDIPGSMCRTTPAGTGRGNSPCGAAYSEECVVLWKYASTLYSPRNTADGLVYPGAVLGIGF